MSIRCDSVAKRLTCGRMLNAKMLRLSLHRLTAVSLSLWLGFLACLLGCAPTFAASITCKTYVSVGENTGATEAGSCCEHRHSGKSQQASTVSCCPMEATLTQKQNPVASLRPYVLLLIVALSPFHTAVQLSASAETIKPEPWRASRDVLLQSSLLRI